MHRPAAPWRISRTSTLGAADAVRGAVQIQPDLRRQMKISAALTAAAVGRWG